MKLRVGNGCWHAGHIQVAAYCQAAGLFAPEGIDVEVVTAKIYAEGLKSSRPDGERYDEVGTVLRDMIAFNIDIIPDVHVRTPSPSGPWATTNSGLSAAGATSFRLRWSLRRGSNRSRS